MYSQSLIRTTTILKRETVLERILCKLFLVKK